MKLKITNKKVIEVQDWDNLVFKTYGKPYSFQQQYGCQERGNFYLSVPEEYTEDDEMHDSIPEKVNGDKRGVKFNVWLERDPKKPLKGKEGKDNWLIELFWERNFYPDIQTVANDLYEKGLLKKGEYTINIDW